MPAEHRRREELERRLRRHYEGLRAARPTPGAETVAVLAARMTEEARGAGAPGSSGAPMRTAPAAPAASAPAASTSCAAFAPTPGGELGFAAFVAAQARFMPLWTWAIHGALLAVALVLAASTDSTRTLAAGTSLVGAAVALAGLPALIAAKTCGTAELEGASYYATAGVTAARLIAIGAADALVLGCAVALMPLLGSLPFLENLLHLCLPFFAGTAGCLLIARSVRPARVASAAASWSTLVLAGAYGFAAMAPALYDGTSLAVWAVASAAAGVWLGREAWLLMAAAARGPEALRALAPTS